MARHSTWRGYLDATQREMKSWSMWHFYVRGELGAYVQLKGATALIITNAELRNAKEESFLEEESRHQCAV